MSDDMQRDETIIEIDEDGNVKPEGARIPYSELAQQDELPPVKCYVCGEPTGSEMKVCPKHQQEPAQRDGPTNLYAGLQQFSVQRDELEGPELNPNIDGLVSNCASCGQRVPFDYNIDDNWWNQTVPDEMRRDVLCLPCLEQIADGVPLHLIRVVYYTGHRGTLTLIPRGVADHPASTAPADEPQRDELEGPLVTLEEIATCLELGKDYSDCGATDRAKQYRAIRDLFDRLEQELDRCDAKFGTHWICGEVRRVLDLPDGAKCSEYLAKIAELERERDEALDRLKAANKAAVKAINEANSRPNWAEVREMLMEFADWCTRHRQLPADEIHRYAAAVIAEHRRGDGDTT